MDTTDPTQPGPTNMTPPTEFDELPEKPSRWPTVIGVIAIIYASLGLLGGCCGVAYPVVFPRFVNWMSSVVPPEQVDLMRAQQPPVIWVLLGSMVGLFLSILLMVGAIRLVRRNPSSVKLCMIWAGIALPWTIIAVVIGWITQPTIPPDLQQLAGPGALAGQVIGACIGLTWGCSLPILMLIWLSRAKIKAEVAEWPLQREEVI